MAALDQNNFRGMALNNKEIVNAYQQFNKDELERLQILPVGTLLEQNTTYFDLKDRDRGEFKSNAGTTRDRKIGTSPKARSIIPCGTVSPG